MMKMMRLHRQVPFQQKLSLKNFSSIKGPALVPITQHRIFLLKALLMQLLDWKGPRAKAIVYHHMRLPHYKTNFPRHRQIPIRSSELQRSNFQYVTLAIISMNRLHYPHTILLVVVKFIIRLDSAVAV